MNLGGEEKLRQSKVSAIITENMRCLMVSGSGAFVRRRVVGKVQCWVLRSGGIEVLSQKGALQ